MAEKKKEKVVLTVFQRRVLGCVTEIRRTCEEIHASYVLQYPRGKVMKVFMPVEDPRKIGYALSVLDILGLVRRDLLSYTDKPLEKETDVYCLSNEGRSLLSHKRH